MSPKKTTSNKTGNKKKDVRPAGPGALSAGDGLDSVDAGTTDPEPKEVESFSATGLDNVLDLLEVVTAKTDKASIGQQAAIIEKHPEVSVTLVHSFPSLIAMLSPFTAKVQGENLPARVPC